MGSVISYCKCERCGGLAYEDYYYYTQEEYHSCQNCGRGWKITLKRDENHKPILDENGKPIYEFKEWEGYGVVNYMGKAGVGNMYHLTEPLTEEIKQKFLKEIEVNEELLKEECYLTSWNEKTQKLEVVYGKVPPNFGEEEGGT